MEDVRAYTPKERAKDTTIFDPDNTDSVGAGSSAFMFLQNLVDWTARQKIEAKYSIPVTATNLTLDMVDRVAVNDAIYTKGNDFEGWVMVLEDDIKNDQIKVTTLIAPDYADQLDDDYPGDIVETGSQTDTITESGTQTDTITEGA